MMGTREGGRCTVNGPRCQDHQPSSGPLRDFNLRPEKGKASTNVALISASASVNFGMTLLFILFPELPPLKSETKIQQRDDAALAGK